MDIHKPSSHHIRQVLYLALYPVGPVIREAHNTKKPSGNVLVPPSSGAVSAALDLLNSFLITLPPSVILNALPSYGARIDYSPGLSDHYALASAATAICSAESCWEFLRPNFLQPSRVGRTKSTFSAPPSSAAVAENAWPVLEWLVAVFERTSDTSPLLSQIPTTTSGPRFAIEAIMDVIFCAFTDTSNHRHMTIGEHLSNMVFIHATKYSLGWTLILLLQLIDLTRSHVSLICPDRLVRETTSRLHDLPSSESLSAFISSLRRLDFKLAVCALYLAHYSYDDYSQGLSGGTPCKARFYGGRVITSSMSKDASSSRGAGPYPMPPIDSLESALLLPPDIEGSVEPQSLTQNSSPFSPLSPVQLRSSQVAMAALQHAIIKLGLIGAASSLGIRIRWDGREFASSASVLENQLFNEEDEVAAATAGIKDAEFAATCILQMFKT
jgi:hypothetical protein